MDQRRAAHEHGQANSLQHAQASMLRSSSRSRSVSDFTGTPRDCGSKTVGLGRTVGVNGPVWNL